MYPLFVHNANKSTNACFYVVQAAKKRREIKKKMPSFIITIFSLCIQFVTKERETSSRYIYIVIFVIKLNAWMRSRSIIYDITY
jgi:hypothetical protein